MPYQPSQVPFPTFPSLSPDSLTISLFASIYPSLVCRVSPLVYGWLMDSGAALVGNRIVKTPD